MKARQPRWKRCEERLEKMEGVSSLANPGESERRELSDGRLAERGREQHTSDALVERGSGNASH